MCLKRSKLSRVKESRKPRFSIIKGLVSPKTAFSKSSKIKVNSSVVTLEIFFRAQKISEKPKIAETKDKKPLEPQKKGDWI